MKKNVIILGAGGHAKVIAEIVIKSGDNVVGFLDDDSELLERKIYLEKEVIGRIEDCKNFDDNYFIIGIGNNRIRKEMVSKYNLKWYTAVHPSAIIASDVRIDEGTVIMPGTVINPGTKVGKHCIVNTSCSIDHDNVIEDFVHISPGAHLAGTVFVGAGSWICTGANVINNIRIGSECIIGAGATVIKNITEKGTYIGVPARIM